MTKLAALNLSEGALSQQLTEAKHCPNSAIKEVCVETEKPGNAWLRGDCCPLGEPPGLEPGTR
jgi:hypothetical protein